MGGFGIIGSLAIVAAILGGIFALLTWAAGLITALSVYFVLVCLFMSLVILVQRPKGGGLAGAFGGAGGGGEGAFGAKSGDALTWTTVGCFLAFISLAMGLTWAMRPEALPEPESQVTPPISAPAEQPPVEPRPEEPVQTDNPPAEPPAAEAPQPPATDTPATEEPHEAATPETPAEPAP